MFHCRSGTLLLLMLLWMPPAVPAAETLEPHPLGRSPTDPLLREAHDIVVAGRMEQWTLRWEAPPVPVCDAGDPAWMTCPCDGFAFGESAPLVLVRARKGREVERLPLTPYFDDGFDHPGDSGNAVVRSREIIPQDLDRADDAVLPADVARRPLARVMTFADYDHDGKATEFLVQTGVLPCGKRMEILVGVPRKMPMLHVFGTADHPERPLVLQFHEWDALLHANGTVRVIDSRCGDHASETETELELTSRRDGFHVSQRKYGCTVENQRGKLLSGQNQAQADAIGDPLWASINPAFPERSLAPSCQEPAPGLTSIPEE